MWLKPSLTKTIIPLSYVEVIVQLICEVDYVSHILAISSVHDLFAAYNKALEDAVAVLDKIAMPIDVNDRKLFFPPDIFLI